MSSRAQDGAEASASPRVQARLVGQARQAGLGLALTVLAGFAGGLLIILQARLLARTVGDVFLNAAGLAQIRPLLTALLLVMLTRAGLTYLGERAAGEVAVRVKSGLRRALLEKLTALGPANARAGQTGELAAAALQGVDALDAYYSQYLPQLALAALVPLAILVAVFPLDWLSGLVLLLTAPLIPLFMVLIGRTAESMTRKQWTALSRMSAFFLDTLQGLTTLKMLAQETAQAGRIAAVSERYRQATLNVLRVTFLSALVLELVGTLSTAVVAVEIGLRLLYGRLAFEQAFFILIVAPEFYFPLRQLGLRFHAGTAGVSAARRIFAVLQTPVPPEPAQPAAVPPGFERIEFREVGYTYPDRAEAALNTVSFTLRRGEQIALVGASGAGKSTLAAMLLRFIDPAAGEILVDGRPLAEFARADWRERVAWVPQQPTLFAGTLRENICLGRPAAEIQAVRRAAAQASLLDWIDTLPAGLETVVGEQGARLSGGQAQRVALARAFLKDAPLLVMDEPTAHLDPHQEALLEEATRRLCAGRTALIIAHRLPTAARADRVLVLEHGRLVEQGAPADLLAQDGAYARLAQAWQEGARP